MGNPAGASLKSSNKNAAKMSKSNVSTPAPVVVGGLVRPPLDVYKKLSIIFKSTDTVVYETISGVDPATKIDPASAPLAEIKSVPVSELGEVALTAVGILLYFSWSSAHCLILDDSIISRLVLLGSFASTQTKDQYSCSKDW